MNLYPTDGESIDLITAITDTRRYRTAHGTDFKAQFFGATRLMEILRETDCVGIRIYNSVNGDGQQGFILVGAKADNTDMYILEEGEKIIANGPTCPGCCAVNSALNE